MQTLSCMYMCVCTYIYTYVYMCVWREPPETYLSICTCTCMCMNIYVYIELSCMYVSECGCVYTYTDICEVAGVRGKRAAGCTPGTALASPFLGATYYDDSAKATKNWATWGQDVISEDRLLMFVSVTVSPLRQSAHPVRPSAWTSSLREWGACLN